MDKSKLEIIQLLVVSTANITEADDDALGANVGSDTLHLNAAKDSYGYFVYTGFVEDRTAKDFVEAGYSEAVFNVLKAAHDAGCIYVKFDCDGETIEGLEVFDW